MILKRVILWIIVLFAVVNMANANNILRNMDIWQGRLVLDFAKPINTNYIHSFSLKSNSVGMRYVFDFKNTILSPANIKKRLTFGKKVRSIRAAQYKKSIARVVIETTESYELKSYKAESNKYVITLPRGSKDLKTSIKDLFNTINIELPGQKKQEIITKPQPLQQLPVSKQMVQPKGNNPYVITMNKNQKPKSINQQSNIDKKGKNPYLINQPVIIPKKRYRIIIDPGHGGHDSGAVDPSRKYIEKKAVLQIGLKLRKHLQAMGFSVLMTRTGDRFVKLSNRTKFANRNNGDIFVSIHANAVPKRKSRKRQGIETYFLQVTRSERAKRVAAMENSVVLNRSDWLSKNVILNAIYTGPKIVLSNKLAIDVQKGMLSRLRKRYKGVKDGGVRPAPFWVLVGAEMPAILVETGYITHYREKKRLFDPRYQDTLAKGIAEGIARYLANREKEIE